MRNLNYKKADDRRQTILKVACEIAELSSYRDITREAVACASDTAPGNVSRIMGTMAQLKHQVIEYAIETGRAKVVVQGIIDKHPAVHHLTRDERQSFFNIAASF